MTKPTTIQPDLNPDINFLFEMGTIRHIDRMWKRYMGNGVANLAEHHFRVFWLAMVIASHEGNVDTGKIAKMVLVHDIAESRTGDVDYLSRQYVERNEKLGIQDMLGGTGIEKEFYALWDEYETRESIEAKIAKDADNLDIDFELAEQAANGSPLQKIKKPQRDVVAERKLYTKTAKRIYEQLSSANPHDWHFNSRNRGNAGDWKK